MSTERLEMSDRERRIWEIAFAVAYLIEIPGDCDQSAVAAYGAANRAVVALRKAREQDVSDET